MRRLILMRHGKSDWSDDARDDFDRTLAARGRKAVPRMAAWLAAHGLRPDHALVSGAVRTRETWALLREALRLELAPETRGDLYLTGAGSLLAAIEAAPAAAQTVIVVGHNPGMEVLAHMLAGPGSDEDELLRMVGGFPTAGLAVFALNGDAWSTLTAEGARLEAFVRPRELD